MFKRFFETYEERVERLWGEHMRSCSTPGCGFERGDVEYFEACHPGFLRGLYLRARYWLSVRFLSRASA
jgi:hypothetical protein